MVKTKHFFHIIFVIAWNSAMSEKDFATIPKKFHRIEWISLRIFCLTSQKHECALYAWAKRRSKWKSRLSFTWLSRDSVSTTIPIQKILVDLATPFLRQ